VLTSAKIEEAVRAHFVFLNERAKPILQATVATSANFNNICGWTCRTSLRFKLEQKVALCAPAKSAFPFCVTVKSFDFFFHFISFCTLPQMDPFHFQPKPSRRIPSSRNIADECEDDFMDDGVRKRRKTTERSSLSARNTTMTWQRR
jgi:hypothetical protein